MKNQLFNKLSFLIIAILFTTSSFALSANNGQNFKLYDTDDFKVGVGLQLSYLKGESKEYVYYTEIGYKVSELNWDLDDVLMGGAVLSFDIKNRLFINLGYWDKMSSSKGYMDDSDWMIAGVRTDFSRSRTELTKGKMSDINAAFTFLSLTGDEVTAMFPSFEFNSTLTFQAILGYKYDEWKWEDKGGYYIYNQGMTVGRFDDVPGISYEHDLSVPYVGLAANLNNNKIGVNGFFLYSKWADVEDIDNHWLRDLKFKDSFDGADYFAYGINVNWEFMTDWSLIFSYQSEHIKKVRGDMEVIDTETGDSALYLYDAGFSHKNRSFSASVSYKFA